MSKDEEFERGMAAVRTMYSKQWDAELGFAFAWADDVDYDDDPDGQAILFRKDGANYWFLVGDGQWDADDPRSEMIEALLVERDKDESAMKVARATLEEAEAKMLELAAERDALRAEASDLRSAVISVVAMGDSRRDVMREIWAIRTTANNTSAPFSLARVEARLDTFRSDDVSIEEVQRLRTEHAAAIRNADRLRHGVPIEGDFVCPDSLALTEMTKARDEARAQLDTAREYEDQVRERCYETLISCGHTRLGRFSGSTVLANEVCNRLVYDSLALVEMTKARNKACDMLRVDVESYPPIWRIAGNEAGRLREIVELLLVGQVPK
jgi:hypothetical protein